MATYSFWYSETYTNKGFFEAENDEQAQELLEQVYSSEISLDDLPKWHYKDKGYELDADMATLEEI